MTDLEINKQKLPSWDLADLYPTIDSPEVEKDLMKVDQMTKKFRRNYRGKISKLNEKGFEKLFRDWENFIGDLGHRLMFMQSNGGLASPKFFRGKDAVLSGPAGGVVGAVEVSIRAGEKKDNRF